MRTRTAVAVALAALTAGWTLPAAAQERVPQMRPPVGGVASPREAMILYTARGAAGSCGKDCAEWFVAEGAVQWDTHKRLFNFLDRHAGGKRPMVVDTWGDANLNVAASLGRILRERGYDTTVGMTYPLICARETEAACFALKRAAASPLNAQRHTTRIVCDITCVIMLAGGVRRHIPPGTRVMITGMDVRNRMGANVSDEHREGLTKVYSEQFRRYFTEMGVDAELLEMLARASSLPNRVELPASEWLRLRLVTDAAR